MDKQELIYGEISPKGMKLFAKIEPEIKNFMDIGSGYGKFTWVMASFLGADKAYGIEIDKEKWILANKHFSGKYNPNVIFEYGDFRRYKNLIKKMDVIYCNCTTWHYETVAELADIIQPETRFYHNSSRFFYKHKELHEKLELNVQWVKTPYNFYKLTTTFNR
jgi:SAM-dependent methyltransferase